MTNFTKTKFDYESKSWGVAPISSKITSFQGLDINFLNRLTGKINTSGTFRVLDLGCGGGNIDGYLKKNNPNWSITGIDLSKNTLKTAKNAIPNVKFIKADARRLPKHLKNLDLVMTFDALEHFGGLDNIISAVFERIKDGGHFYVAIPLEKQFPSLYWLINKLGWEGKKKFSGHVNFFDSKGFVSLIESKGFTLLKIRYSYHLLMSVCDIVFYLIQKVTGKSIAFESGVAQMQEGTAKNILNLLKKTISLIGYVESSLFWWLPGGKGHFLFVKKPRSDFFSVHPPLTVAEDYQLRKGLNIALQPRDFEVKRLLNKLGFKNAGTVLDFGCANGIWLERIISGTNKKGFGVDISPVLVHFANSRKGAKGKYLLTDKTWKVPKNSIDFCYSFDTFEHIRNKESEIKKLSVSIKSRGKILIYTLNPNNKFTIDWLFEKFGSDLMYKRADHDKKLFVAPGKLAKILQNNGFINTGFELYDGPSNLIWRVIGFTLAKAGLTGFNSRLLKIVYPINNFLDGFFIRRGYSNGYFLWAQKK